MELEVRIDEYFRLKSYGAEAELLLEHRNGLLLYWKNYFGNVWSRKLTNRKRLKLKEWVSTYLPRLEMLVADYLDEFSSDRNAAYKSGLIYVAGYPEYLHEKISK